MVSSEIAEATFKSQELGHWEIHWVFTQLQQVNVEEPVTRATPTWTVKLTSSYSLSHHILAILRFRFQRNSANSLSQGKKVLELGPAHVSPLNYCVSLMVMILIRIIVVKTQLYQVIFPKSYLNYEMTEALESLVFS